METLDSAGDMLVPIPTFSVVANETRGDKKRSREEDSPVRYVQLFYNIWQGEHGT